MFSQNHTETNSDDWTITKKTTRTIKHENINKTCQERGADHSADEATSILNDSQPVCLSLVRVVAQAAMDSQDLPAWIHIYAY